MNKRPSCGNILQSFALIVSLLCFSVSGKAGEVVWSQYLKGSSIVDNAEIKMSDFILRSDYNKAEYDYKVSFVYGREDRKDVQGSTAWTYRIEYSVSFYDGNLTLQSQSTGNELQISYDPVNPGSIVLEAHKLFNASGVDFEKVKLQITDITPIAAVMPQDVRVELSLINKSGFEFKGNIPTMGFDNTNTRLYWSYIKGADYYQVEYVYVDDEEVHTAFTQPWEPFEYREPVRILLKEQYFDRFSFTFPVGKIYMRFRAAGAFGGVATTSERVTAWYYLPLPVTISTDFEPAKNWQYVTSYAEEGKYKKVMTYYDGSLRTRQVLTNLSSDNIILAGETKYDFEGRPVVNVLPVPLTQTSLNYVNNLNLFTQGKAGYDKTMVTTQAESLDVLSKAHIYYSPLNPEKNLPGFSYIPDAEGYPYSQVLYTRDGTGRPKMQSGVGETFRLGDPTLTNKNTSFKYSSANNTELHRLFGSNVGNASHYKKNYVTDPNGQRSVSYLDQEGRVVATCLTGSTPDNLDRLSSNDTVSIKVNLDASNTIDRSNKISKTVSIINNIKENTKYTFNYSLKGVINESGLIADFCKECTYDLVFTIKDPDDLVAYTTTVPNIQPAASVENCSTNVYDKGSLIQNVEVFFTKEGEYQVIKELRLTSEALTTSLEVLKTKTGYPQYSTFESIYLSQVDISKCDISCEDNCRSEVLRQNPLWKANPVTYATQINNAVATCVSTYCPAYLAGIVDKVTENECQSVYEQILEQVRPGGVFNADNTWVDNAIVAVNGSGGFKNALGVSITSPTRAQIQDAALFKDDWQDELASQHREYCHYQNCGLLLASKKYDKNMAIVKDWTEAVAKGYVGSGITPLNTDPMFTTAANPGYAPAASASASLLARLTNFTNELTLNIDVDNSGSITNRLVSLEEFVSTYIPYGTNTSYVPDLTTKWRTYRSFYNGFKIDEERKLTGAVTPDYGFGIGEKYKNCDYYSDANAIMQDPVLPSTLEDVNQKNDENMMASCAELCPENAKVWLRMIENNCGEISDVDSIAIHNLLLSYCNNTCGYMNLLGLILAEHINNKPELISVQNILNTCSLENISLENPYLSKCMNGVDLKIWDYTCNSSTFPSSPPFYDGVVPNIDFYTPNYGNKPLPVINQYNMMLKFSTYLWIPETSFDLISFQFNFDNVSNVYIDGVKWSNSFNNNLANACWHNAFQNDESYQLTKGYHHIYIELAQGEGPYRAQLLWSHNNGPFEKIPDNLLFTEIPDDNEQLCTIQGFVECPLDLNSDNDCTNDPIFITTCGEKVLNSVNTLIQKAATGSPHACNLTFYPLVVNQAENILISGCSGFTSQIMLEIPESCDGPGKKNVLVVKESNGFKIFSGNNAAAYQTACACDPGSPYYSGATLSQTIRFYTLDGSGNPVYIPTGDIAYVKEPFVDCAYARSSQAYDFKSSHGVAVKLGKVSGPEIIAYVEVSGFTSGASYLTWKIPGLPPRTLCNNTFTIDWPAIKTECIEKLNNTARYEAYVAWKEAETEFISNYLNEKVDNCFDSPFEEHLTYSYVNNEYHYTLYYYDQAGNLVQTVPPAGVVPLGPAAFNSTTGAYIAGNEPAHKLVTKYKYNSLNQLSWQNTPDGGDTYFWYDSKGQLRLSQNDKQLAASAPTANKYSYTRYDRQGRIEEVGQVNDLTTQTRAYMTNATNEKDILALLDNAAFPVAASTALTQITATSYDAGDGQQENLRGRVASSFSKSTEVATEVVTRYSYDPHGNVKNLRQDITGFAVKRTDYEYDLISGKVNKVYYQKGQSDQFVHQYEYDSDNRIKAVYTSADDVVWEEDARYFYHKHGPLSRVELGQDKVQGLDYYYTIQGWLKGVNIPALRVADVTGKPRVAADIGQDGVTPTNNLHQYIGQDEFSYALGYFNGDYQPILAGLDLKAAGDDHWTSMSTNIKASGLYNGNIATMVTQVHSMGSYTNPSGSFLAKEQAGLHGYAYHYDQLNRITAAAHYKEYTSGGWTARALLQSGASQPFDARYAYDPNGNITDAFVNGQTTALMDNLSYQYNKSGSYLLNNRLNHVLDAAGQPEVTDLPGTQALNNYQYDAIGNLTSDASEGVTDISWSVYGKVLSVLNSSNSKADLTFTYDAMGNRVKKLAVIPAGGTKTTYYARDASGNIMATYEVEGATTTTEFPIYGSSRLGAWEASAVTNGVQRRIPLKKQYELSNHLGNVLSTINGLKIGVDLNSDYIADYYTARSESGQDYYPFGMSMPGRRFGSDYRFGFNGKEKDGEWSSGEATYDYGFRIYDPRLGKFLSVDPLSSSYPWNSPYAFAENDVIRCIDLEGGEKLIRIWGYDKYGKYTVLNSFTSERAKAQIYFLAEQNMSKGNISYFGNYTKYKAYGRMSDVGTLDIHSDGNGGLMYVYDPTEDGRSYELTDRIAILKPKVSSVRSPYHDSWEGSGSGGIGGSYKIGINTKSVGVRVELFGNTENDIGFNLEFDYSKSESMKFGEEGFGTSQTDFKINQEFNAYLFLNSARLSETDGFEIEKKQYIESSAIIPAPLGTQLKLETNTSGKKRFGITTGKIGVKVGITEKKSARWTTGTTSTWLGGE